MDSLLNFSYNDGDNQNVFDRSGRIHIRVQQMGKKWLTTLEGLDKDLDQRRIAKALAKAFHCAASTGIDERDNQFIKIQGNKKEELREWLVKNEVLSESEARDRLVVHGA